MEGHLVAEVVRPARRRTLEDRVALRLPWLYRPLLRAIGRLYERLPPGSRIRSALIRKTVARSYGAWNRGDVAVLVAMYHPSCVWAHYPGFGAGWPEDTRYEGHQGLREVVRVWWDSFGEYDGTATDVRDCGDHLRITVRAVARGRVSGLRTEMSWTQVSAQRDGLVWFVGQGTDRFPPPE